MKPEALPSHPLPLPEGDLPAYFNIPRYEDYRLTEDIARIQPPEAVLSWCRYWIEQCLKKNPQVVLSFDGPSGSGKTTFCDQVEDYFSENPGKGTVVRLETDQFLGTLVGSDQRREMLTSGKKFWGMVNDWETIARVLKDIRGLGEEGGTVNLPKTYHRDHFKYHQPLEIPEGKKVIVVGGLKITRPIDKIYSRQRERIKALVYTPAQVSIASALIRDIRRGKITNVHELAERHNQRVTEADYQLPKFKKMMEKGDVAVIDNVGAHPNMCQLMQTYHELVSKVLEGEFASLATENSFNSLTQVEERTRRGAENDNLGNPPVAVGDRSRSPSSASLG